jgi:hypothetical protein
MEISLPLSADLWLQMTSGHSGEGPYPTARLRKGWLLIQSGQALVEEAVGLGVPVLKRGLQTIFPGSVELATSGGGPVYDVTATFLLNLEEKIAQPAARSIQSAWLYAVKNTLAAVIRQAPLLRGPLTALSNALRSAFGWQTLFERAAFAATVRITYSVDTRSGVMNVKVDAGGLSNRGVTEVVVMNELGARAFDHYHDASGLSLHGPAIGCWDEVAAEQATFVSAAHHLAFTLPRIDGARLYRGRELIGARLAWAGFGYSFSPTEGDLRYTLKIERLP